MNIEAELEHTAIRLARAAGERIAAALEKPLRVDFKPAGSGAATNSNPVSHVDRDVETYLREQLETAYPRHAIIGEEKGGASTAEAEFTWVLDPIDGTTNFINGLPLFASSIGVLRDGEPVAGAIWCATSHALKPGVYHARRGQELCFEGAAVVRREAAAWRGVAALPRHMRHYGVHWDTRVFGSATLELAFVAAGLLRLSFLWRPSLWDAAAGVLLAKSAGCTVMTLQESRWIALERFEALDRWRQPLLVGDPQAVALAQATAADSAAPKVSTTPARSWR